MVVAVVAPASAYAGTGTRSYVYREWDATAKTVRQETRYANCEDIDKGDDATIGNGWYITGEDDNDINTVYVDENSVVNIIVKDGTTQITWGIVVPASSTLNIYGQPGGTGVLKNDQDENHYAGIGGKDDCGTINIFGGKIEAIGESSDGDDNGGAGIGGGWKGAGGRLPFMVER